LDSWPRPSALVFFSSWGSRGYTCRRSSSTTAPPTALEDWPKSPVRALDRQAHPHQALHAADQRGKANGFIKNHPMANGYVIAYQNIGMNATAGYPRYLGIYNGSRCHMLSVALTPQQCFQRLVIAE